MPGPMTGGKPLPPMISFVGHSGSGKTTLLVKLIPELKRRGYRIGTVKHTHHEPETHDRGKDSTRHKEAGAETVIFASSRRISLDKETPGDDPEALLPYFHDMDLVITEGFKRKNRPKIEVYRTTTHAGPLYRGQADFVAMVTDADLPLEIRKFHLEDIAGLADFIEEDIPGRTPRGRRTPGDPPPRPQRRAHEGTAGYRIDHRDLVSASGLYPAQTGDIHLNERRLSGDRQKKSLHGRSPGRRPRRGKKMMRSESALPDRLPVSFSIRKVSRPAREAAGPPPGTASAGAASRSCPWGFSAHPRKRSGGDACSGAAPDRTR